MCGILNWGITLTYTWMEYDAMHDAKRNINRFESSFICIIIVIIRIWLPVDWSHVFHSQFTIDEKIRLIFPHFCFFFFAILNWRFDKPRCENRYEMKSHQYWRLLRSKAALKAHLSINTIIIIIICMKFESKTHKMNWNNNKMICIPYWWSNFPCCIFKKKLLKI